uniref:Uncharacterized protein n=1 Tax=Klebsiella sp. T5-5 TaxID=1778875 RepID=A0A140D6L0_9ENTR|nr:hypothetical protein [Klebsiella sp. T5-5]
MQAMATCATSNRERAEEGTLQQNVLRFVIHARVFTTENAAHCQRFLMVSDNQSIGIKLRFRAIQKNQRLPFMRHTYDNPAFNAVFVECMHRLTQFKQHIVGDVNHSIDRADTAAAQLFLHPQRSRCFNIDAFHYAAQIARACIRRINLNRQNIINSRRNRSDFRSIQRSFVEHGHIASNTNNTQAVGTVRRDADFDGVIVQLQVFTDVGTQRRISRQFDNAAMIVGNTQLGERTQHTFRRLAAQFRRFNFKITRQYGADGCNRNLQTLTTVRRTADDVQQTFAANVDFRYTQFVSIRVLSAFNHFTHDNAVEASRDRLNTVNFEACHGYLVRQRFAVDGRVNPLA